MLQEQRYRFICLAIPKSTSCILRESDLLTLYILYNLFWFFSFFRTSCHALQKLHCSTKSSDVNKFPQRSPLYGLFLNIILMDSVLRLLFLLIIKIWALMVGFSISFFKEIHFNVFLILFWKLIGNYCIYY